MVTVQKYLDTLGKVSGLTEVKQHRYLGNVLLDMLGYDGFDPEQVDIDTKLGDDLYNYKLVSNKFVIFIKFGADRAKSDIAEIDGKPVITCAINERKVYMACKKYNFRIDTDIENTDYISIIERDNADNATIKSIEEYSNKISSVAKLLADVYNTGEIDDALFDVMDIGENQRKAIREAFDNLKDSREPIAHREDVQHDIENAPSKDDFDSDFEEDTTASNAAKEEDDDLFDDEPMDSGSFRIPDVDKLSAKEKKPEYDDDPFA